MILTQKPKEVLYSGGPYRDGAAARAPGLGQLPQGLEPVAGQGPQGAGRPLAHPLAVHPQGDAHLTDGQVDLPIREQEEGRGERRLRVLAHRYALNAPLSLNTGLCPQGPSTCDPHGPPSRFTQHQVQNMRGRVRGREKRERRYFRRQRSTRGRNENEFRRVRTDLRMQSLLE